MPSNSQAYTPNCNSCIRNMVAEFDLPTIDRTSNVLTIHIHLHLTNSSHKWSLATTCFTIVSIVVLISVLVAIWRVFISSALQASASTFERESWSHGTNQRGSFYGESDCEDNGVFEAENENKGRRWAELVFLARQAGRTKSD